MHKINYNILTDEEKILALSIQGLANREVGNIILDADNYLEYVDKDRLIELSLIESLEVYKSLYKGIVLYDFIVGDININIAFNIATCEDYIVVASSLYNKENYSSLFKQLPIIDLRNLEGDYIDKQRKFFNQYKEHLNKDGLIHQVCLPDNYHLTLRDQAINKHWFCFYTGEDTKAKAFRKDVLVWANKNIAIYGWTSDEIDFVDDISQYGDYIIPADWSLNHSVLDKIKGTSLKQHKFNTNILPNKHYATIVVSDGDNIQWLERTFAFESTFKQRLEQYVDYPIGWTIAPSMVNTSVPVINYIYKLAKRDYFVTGVSGAGYMNPCVFPKQYLKPFVDKTEELMKKTDLEVVTLLDNLRNEDAIPSIIEEYASRDTILGGIYELDPICYKGGNGKIYFASNNKPFISVKISLWGPDNTHDSVTKEWLDGIIKQLNDSIVDPTSEQGYTVINFHPWSFNIEDLNYIVKNLQEHIQIVKPDELIKLVKTNIIH